MPKRNKNKWNAVLSLCLGVWTLAAPGAHGLAYAQSPAEVPGWVPVKASDSGPVYLTSDDEADVFANQVFEEVMSGDSKGLTTTLTFVHFAEQGKALNPYLKRAIETVDRRLYSIGKSHRVAWEINVLTKAEFEAQQTERLSAMAPLDERDLKIKYKKEFGEEMDPALVESTRRHWGVPALLKRMKQMAQNIFGIRNGITLREHFSYPTGSDGERSPRTPMSRASRLRLATKTAAIGMLGFTGIVAGPWGFLDFLGPTHLTSAALLGSWVWTCLYNIDRLQSFKSQGVSAEIEGDHVQVRSRRTTYTAITLAQEIFCNILITGALVGWAATFDALLTWEDFKKIWGVLIVANAAVAGMSYIPVEVYGARTNAKSALLLAQANEARLADNEAVALKFEGEAIRVSRKANKVMDVWWNVVFPLFVKYLPFGVLLGLKTGDETTKWFVSNSVGLGFALFGIGLNIYQVAGYYRDKFRLKWGDPLVAPCETTMTVKQN